MSSETREAMKEKNKAFRSWMTSKSNLQRDAARLKYTKLRNKAKTLLRKSRRLFKKGIAQSRRGAVVKGVDHISTIVFVNI